MTLKQLWLNWKEVAEYAGDFQARWLLTVFYFVVLLPFGLVVSLLSDPLAIHSNPSKSGWVKRKTTDLTLRQGRRQF